MAVNLKDALTQLNADKSGAGKRAPGSTTNISGKDIQRYTAYIKQFGKEWKKAIDKNDVKKVNELSKSFAKLKIIEQNRSSLEKYNKTLQLMTQRLSEAEKAQDPEKAQKYMNVIKNLSQQMEEIKTESAQVSESFKKVNDSLLGKGWEGLKKLTTSKWTQFATATAAAGFFANGLKNIDKSSMWVSRSLEQMPVDQVAKEFREATGHGYTLDKGLAKVGGTAGETSGHVDALVDATSTLTGHISDASKVHARYATELNNAALLQQNLAQISIKTGKSIEEVEETAAEAQQAFNVSIKDGGTQLTQMSLAAINLGKSLQIGTADALEKFRMRTQDMGVSMRDAQLEMAGVKRASDELRNGQLKLNITAKQYTDLVYSTVDADSRSSQNLRIKNQLIQNTIDLLIRQGKTQKEAMEIAKGVVKANVEASESVKVAAGIDMANDFKVAWKGGEDAQASYIKKATEGMDTEAAAKMAEQLKEQFKTATKEGGVDIYSTGKVLMQRLGSQQSGMEALLKEQSRRFGGMKETLIASLLLQEGDVQTLEEGMVRAKQIKAMKEGKVPVKDILTLATKTEGKPAAKTEEETFDNMNAAAEAATKAGPMTDTFMKAGTAFFNNPIVSFSASALAALAAILMTKGLAGGVLGGLGKAGGLGTIAKGAGGLLARGAVGAGGLISSGASAAAGLALPAAGLAAAGGVGWLAGRGIDKAATALTGTKNKYGQESNIFEKGIAKIFATKEQYEDLYGTGAPPPTVLPKMAPTAPITGVTPGTPGAPMASGAPGGPTELLADYNGRRGQDIILVLKGGSLAEASRMSSAAYAQPR